MKSIATHPMTRLLAAAVLGTVVLFSFYPAQSAEESAARQAQSGSPSMDARWQQIQQTIRPDLAITRSEEFQKDYPDSPYQQANIKLQAGARKAFSALRQARLSADALEEPTHSVPYRTELLKALRGNQDSAYRLALMYRQGSHGLPRDPQRARQWLRVAAELGNGRASWEVANIYNRDGAMADAATFEAKAVRDGFRIPPRMPNRNLEY